MSYKKKMLCFLCILTAAVFAACTGEMGEMGEMGETAEDDFQPAVERTTAAQITSGGSVAAPPEESEPEPDIPPQTTEFLPPYEFDVPPLYESSRLPAELPEMDFGGYNFKILTRMLNAENKWQTRDIEAEELTGEPLNDAVFHRNAALSEKYNFNVENLLEANVLETIRREISSGDIGFDVVSLQLGRGLGSVQGGYFADLYSIDHLDLEKPWWDGGATAALSIGGRIFFISGVCLTVNMDTLPAVLFNRELLAEFALEDPYEAVRGGFWTWDKLSEMARAATVNFDGTGWMKAETDRYGLIAATWFMPLMHGAGARVSDKDADDMPFLIWNNDITWAAGSVYNEIISQIKNTFLFNKNFSDEDAQSFKELVFEEGRGLFFITRMKSVEMLRQTGLDFGILPMPWFNRAQREWGHSVNAHDSRAQVMAVPAFQDGEALARVGFMLEALAAESRYSVIPAYCDLQLAGKDARDDESREMLDVIFGSMVWDIGAVFDWFNLFTYRISTGPMHYNNVYEYELRVEAIEAEMQRTIDALMN